MNNQTYIITPTSFISKCKNKAQYSECHNNEKKFAFGLCFYKLVWIFTLCSMFGVVLEMIFCLIFKGYLESRQGMIYGPFNQIYGIGAVLLSLILHDVKDKSPITIFTISAFAGGILEVLSSYGQELLFGTVSWDYKWMPFALSDGRTNILYMVFFGLLGIVFIRLIYPFLSSLIEQVQKKRGVVLSWIMILFMCINLFISAIVVKRWTARQMGTPPVTYVDYFIDKHYPDEMLNQIYPTMTNVSNFE